LTAANVIPSRVVVYLVMRAASIWLSYVFLIIVVLQYATETTKAKTGRDDEFTGRGPKTTCDCK